MASSALSMHVIKSVEDFENYRLTVETREECTLRLVSDPSTGRTTWQTWTRKRNLGHGAFGEVWQEAWEDHYGDLHYRAVKICSESRMRAARIDYKRELSALATFAKSENILVCQKRPEFHRWWVKIADFGLSKQIAADSGSALHSTVGTRPYCAPEILGYLERYQKTSVYTSKIDMWSLGCVLFTLGSHGRLPFTELELSRYCDGRVQLNIQNLPSHLSDHGVLFIKALLQTEPEQRPTAAEALQHAWLTAASVTIPRSGSELLSGTRKDYQQNFNSFLDSTLSAVPAPDSSTRKVTIHTTTTTGTQGGDETIFVYREMPIMSRNHSNEDLNTSDMSQTFITPSESPGVKEWVSDPTMVKTTSPESRSVGDVGNSSEFAAGTNQQRPNDNQTKRPGDLRSETSDLDRWLKDNKVVLEQNRNEFSETELYLAVKQGQLQIVKLLKQSGVSLDVRNIHGVSPLQAGAYFGQLEVVAWLVENNACSSAKDDDGLSALHWAAAGCRLEVVQFLLKQSANIHIRDDDDNDGWTILHHAAHNGAPKVVKWLSEKGADVSAKTKDGSSALHLAVSNGKVETATWLMDNGADINAKRDDGGTPLHFAVAKGNLEVARLLVNRGANIHERCEKGQTCLYQAAYHGHLPILEWAREQGADIHVKDANGATLLFPAASAGQLEVVRWLLKHDADIHIKADEDTTPLYLAAFNGHLEMVMLLTNQGVDVNAKTQESETPLSMALWGGHPEVAKILVERGADVNAKGLKGTTSLHAAASEGSLEMVKWLVDRGANVHAKDDDNDTPRYWAEDNENFLVEAWLKEQESTRKDVDT